MENLRPLVQTLFLLVKSIYYPKLLSSQYPDYILITKEPKDGGDPCGDHVFMYGHRTMIL